MSNERMLTQSEVAVALDVGGSVSVAVVSEPRQHGRRFRLSKNRRHSPAESSTVCDGSLLPGPSVEEDRRKSSYLPRDAGYGINHPRLCARHGRMHTTNGRRDSRHRECRQQWLVVGAKISSLQLTSFTSVTPLFGVPEDGQPESRPRQNSSCTTAAAHISRLQS